MIPDLPRSLNRPDHLGNSLRRVLAKKWMAVYMGYLGPSSESERFPVCKAIFGKPLPREVQNTTFLGEPECDWQRAGVLPLGWEHESPCQFAWWNFGKDSCMWYDNMEMLMHVEQRSFPLHSHQEAVRGCLSCPSLPRPWTWPTTWPWCTWPFMLSAPIMSRGLCMSYGNKFVHSSGHVFDACQPALE